MSLSHPVFKHVGMGGWPWDALAGWQNLVVEWNTPFRDLDGASWPGDPHVVMLRTGLTQIERRCVLAHELVHLERGGGCQHPDPVVQRREEHHVNAIVADRLVPLDEMRAWLARCEDPVTVDDVAERWRVTPRIATAAMRRVLELGL